MVTIGFFKMADNVTNHLSKIDLKFFLTYSFITSYSIDKHLRRSVNIKEAPYFIL